MKVSLLEQEKEHFKVAKESIEIILRCGFDCALIGGAVRDLLRRKIKNASVLINDLDFCVFDKNGDSIGFDEMQNLVDTFAEEGFDIDPAGMKFLHFLAIKNGFEVEFGTPRKESYMDDSRKPFCVPGNFHDDQKRRDFTINAIFAKIICSDTEVDLNIIAGENGVKDIHNDVLRTIDGNLEKVFSDDPVRILRAIRFSKYGFDPTFQLRNFIKNFSEKEFRKVSQERLFDELKKILMKGDIDFLFESGMIFKLIPEFKEFIGKPFENNELVHIVNVIKNADTINMKLVGLFHDIGKAYTGTFSEEKGRWQFINHEIVSKDLSKKILQRFKADNDTIKFVSGVVGSHMKVKFMTNFKKTTLIRHLLTDKFIIPAMEFNKFDWNGKPEKFQIEMKTKQHQFDLEKIIFNGLELIKSKLTNDHNRKIVDDVCNNPNIPEHERGKNILDRKVSFISK